MRLPQVGTILRQLVLEKRNQPLLVITIQFARRLFKNEISRLLSAETYAVMTMNNISTLLTRFAEEDWKLFCVCGIIFP